MMDSMTKIFPVTVTKLRDPVTKAIKNISRALYGLAVPTPFSPGEQDVESLVDMLHEVLENMSAVWLTDDPEGRKKEVIRQNQMLGELCQQSSPSQWPMSYNGS